MSNTDPFITSPTLSAFSDYSSISSPSSLPESDSESDFVSVSPQRSRNSMNSNRSNPFSLLDLNSNKGFSGRSVSNASSPGRSNSPFSSFSSVSSIWTGSFGGIEPDTEIDAPTQLLLAQLTLADLVAYKATLKSKRPITRSPDDTELALQQQEDELRRLITFVKDSVLAKSIDTAVETDTELIRALEVMEQSEREDRRAAEILSREDRLPQLTEAQNTVGRKGFIVPERKDEEDEDEDDGKTVIGDDTLGSTSFFSRRTSYQPSRPTQSVQKLECVACNDKHPKTRCLIAKCAHIYCFACVISLVEACIRDESLYPVKCCQQPLSRTQLGSILSVKLRVEFEDKCREFGTPAQSRVYCSNPRCSAFLGSSSEEIDDIFCGSCRTSTCTGCKRISHPHEGCQEHVDMVKLRQMATDEGWQTCPGCKAIIELDTGCYHMTCRCHTEFCYLCAARWKTCGCRQWDEERIVVDAQRRVVNEMGERARFVEPRVYENQVRARVEELRTRHECVVHDWRNRQGGGQCEHCGDYLPIFLKVCRGCSMLVCRRCALNRL